MKDNVFEKEKIEINNPNDRHNLVLLKYLTDRTTEEKKRYELLLELYPDNEYYNNEVVNRLVTLELMNKNYTKEATRTASGAIIPGEFVPVTNYAGRKALKNLFPSEYEERNRVIHHYKIERRYVWVAVLGGISGFIGLVISLITLLSKYPY